MSLIHLKRALPVLLGLLVGGCGNLGTPAPQFEFFDLGLAQPIDPPPRVSPRKIEVRAPTWLSSGAMQYSFDYRQPPQREAYSETRWVAEPGEMLRLSLERALTANRSGEGECRLLVELDEFSQVFEAVDKSQVRLVVRTTLLAPRGNDVLARWNGAISEAAPTPDAAGGVIAHRRAVQRLASELATWLSGLDPANVAGSQISERCGQ